MKKIIIFLNKKKKNAKIKAYFKFKAHTLIKIC